MSGTMKTLTAPFRYLKRYTNPFWKWADKLVTDHIWEITKDVYGVDGDRCHDTIYSMVCLCKRTPDKPSQNISKEFRELFCEWEEALKMAGLTDDTLKLHNAPRMPALESRLYKLKTMSTRCVRGKMIPSIYKHRDVRRKPSSTEVKSMSESLNDIARQSIVRRYSHDSILSGNSGSLSLTSTGTQTSILNIEIPPSFKRSYPDSSFSEEFTPPSFVEYTFSPDVTPGLTFPFQGNPLETIQNMTKEIVETKLSLKPEAWISQHFLTSTWEMFHFGEEMIGNFIVAPNFLKEEDEEPSLDLFFWSGNPDNPSFYACPINRDVDGFFLHESELKFTSLVSLVTHYIFNLTEDIPVYLQHPYLTQLIPSFNLPNPVTLQERYLSRILEYHPEKWLTEEEFDESKIRNSEGDFIIHEDLIKDLVKLYVKVNTPQGLKIDSFEINKFEEGFGLSPDASCFASLASLLSHYCCWRDGSLPCLLLQPTCDLPEDDTAARMQKIIQIVEEVYVARDLSLHPNSWFLPDTEPENEALIRRLATQPSNSFIVFQHKHMYTLMLHREGSEIQPYNIVKSDGTFSFQTSKTAFPSLPLLIAYLCRNEANGLPLLPILEFTPGNFQTGPLQQNLGSFNKGRKLTKRNNIHRDSARDRDPSKLLLDRMQHLMMSFTENPTSWRCTDESEAIKRVRLGDYRSFVVLDCSAKDESYLFVRRGQDCPEEFGKFTIYKSSSGSCGFKKDKYTYSSLTSLLAQCSCVQDKNLPFTLFSEFAPLED